MTDKASDRVELINDIANFIDHKRTPELLFHPRPYPSSGAERLQQHYKQMGQLADFILAREQSLKQEYEAFTKGLLTEIGYLKETINRLREGK